MGGLVCEEISCPKDTKCEIKNGIRACYNTGRLSTVQVEWIILLPGISNYLHFFINIFNFFYILFFFACEWIATTSVPF